MCEYSPQPKLYPPRTLDIFFPENFWRWKEKISLFNPYKDDNLLSCISIFLKSKAGELKLRTAASFVKLFASKFEFIKLILSF